MDVPHIQAKHIRDVCNYTSSQKAENTHMLQCKWLLVIAVVVVWLPVVVVVVVWLLVVLLVWLLVV